MGDDIVANLILRFTTLGQEQIDVAAAQLRGLGTVAEAQTPRVVSMATGISTAMLGIGAVTALAGLGAAKLASDFEDSLARIRGNTGLTAQEIAQIRVETLKLGAEGPAGLNDIATAFEHAANEGFVGAQAMQVVRAGWEAAIATGGSVADTTNALAVVLHNLHAPAADAAQVISVLMATAAAGNIKLPDLVQNFSKIGVTAAAMHIPLADLGAMFATVTKATGDAALAQTQLEGMLVHILNPMGQAKAAFKELGAAGDNLRLDFQKLSNGQISVTKVMEDVRAATHGNAQEIMALFGGIRGGLAALTLLGDGWNSYLATSEKTHHATELLQTEFKNMQSTLGYTTGELKNNAQELAIAFGDALLRPLDALARDIIPVEQGLTSLIETAPGVVQVAMAAGVGIGVLGLAIRSVTFAYGPYAAAVNALRGSQAAGIPVAQQTAVAITETGVAAAAATPEIAGLGLAGGVLSSGLAALGAQALTTDGLIAALDVELAALPEAEVAAAGAGVGLSGAFTAMAGSVVALMGGPVGLIALGAVVGVLAYTQIPAFRNAINGATDHVLGLGDAAHHAQGSVDGLNAQVAKTHDIVQKGGLVAELGNLSGATKKMAQESADSYDLAKQKLQSYYDLMKGATQYAQQQAERQHQQQSVGGAAQDFASTSNDAAKLAKEATLALADALAFGTGNVMQFTTAAVAAQIAANKLADSQTEAGIRVDLASGEATAATQKFVDSIKSKATEAVDLWAVGVVRGAGNLKQLEAAAIGAAKNQVLYDAEIKRVTAQIGKLVPGFADLNAKVPTAAQAMAKAAKAGEDFATALSQKSTRSFDSLVEAVYKGKTHLDGLTDAAIKAAEHSNRWTQTSEQVRLKIDEAAHNWAAALDDMRKILDDRLSSAQGKLQVDRREGAPSSVISGDEAKVKKAQDALTAFEAQTKKSTKSLDDFSTEQTAADKRTKSALDAYALGLMTNAKDLPALKAAYLAAGTESLKFADTLKKAEAALKAHESAYQHLQQEQTTAQTKLNNAIALGVQDIQNHGRVTAAHALEIERDRKALALLTKQTNDAATVGEKLKQSFSDLQTAAQKGATDALDTLAMALLHHASNVGNLADKALFAALASKRFADALTQATQMVALAMGDFTTYLSGLSDAVKKAIDKLATDTYTGAANNPVPLTPQQTKANQILTGQGEPTPFPRGSNGTVGDADIQAIITAQNNYKAGLVAQTSALLKAAAATGDWSAALASVRQQTTDAMNNATAEYVTAVLGLGGSILEATLRIKGAATEQERQNLADAAAAAAVAVAMEQAAVAAGDFAGAFNIQKGIDTKAYQQAIDTIAGKILGHVAVTQADIDAAQAHRIAVEADTQANWDATFAAASVTEKHNMLAQAASGVISRFNSIQGAQSAVDNANLAVLAAQSAVQVGLLQDLVTDTQDQTAVIQASAGVAKAVGDIALAGIKDQAGIITAQGAIAQAKDAAALTVAQDQLRIAIDTRAADIAAAQWAAVVARDNLTIARDKSAADKANEAAQHVVEMDKLKVAIDQVQLTKDQMVLQTDTLQGVDIIASAFADVTDYEAKIQSDLSAIGADQGQIGSDQLQLGKDTATAAQIAAQGALTVAQDQQRLAMDQAAGDASSQAGQMRIALDQNQLARDQVAAQNKTNSLLSQNNSFLQSQMGAMLEALKNFRSGVTYHWIGSGPDPFESWLNGAQAQFAGNPSL